MRILAIPLIALLSLPAAALAQGQAPASDPTSAPAAESTAPQVERAAPGRAQRKSRDRPRRTRPARGSGPSAPVSQPFGGEQREALRQTPVGGLPSILGDTDSALLRTHGQPSLAQAEEGGAMWTYRGQTCVLFVFFERAENGILKVKGASSGPVRRGATAPPVDQCVNEQRSPG